MGAAGDLRLRVARAGGVITEGSSRRRIVWPTSFCTGWAPFAGAGKESIISNWLSKAESGNGRPTCHVSLIITCLHVAHVL